MTQAILRSIASGVTKDYLIEGLLTVNERKSQQTPALPIPTLSDTSAVLPSIMGQVRTFTITFLIVDRDLNDNPDYTNNTGSPINSPTSIEEQRRWLMDTIFKRSGSHKYVDEHGAEYTGRIQDLEFTKQGDDPYSDSCSITFVRGIPLG
jgi:hypothetical protein